MRHSKLKGDPVEKEDIKHLNPHIEQEKESGNYLIHTSSGVMKLGSKPILNQPSAIPDSRVLDLDWYYKYGTHKSSGKGHKKKNKVHRTKDFVNYC